MPLASLTSSVTSAVATHGLWAVFALMLIDAVFPAASELVMVRRSGSIVPIDGLRGGATSRS